MINCCSCFRENKELKANQAKQSMESFKMVQNDRSIKNKAERDRWVFNSLPVYYIKHAHDLVQYLCHFEYNSVKVLRVIFFLYNRVDRSIQWNMIQEGL